MKLATPNFKNKTASILWMLFLAVSLVLVDYLFGVYRLDEDWSVNKISISDFDNLAKTQTDKTKLSNTSCQFESEILIQNFSVDSQSKTELVNKELFNTESLKTELVKKESSRKELSNKNTSNGNKFFINNQGQLINQTAGIDTVISKNVGGILCITLQTTNSSNKNNYLYFTKESTHNGGLYMIKGDKTIQSIITRLHAPQEFFIYQSSLYLKESGLDRALLLNRKS